MRPPTRFTAPPSLPPAPLTFGRTASSADPISCSVRSSAHCALAGSKAAGSDSPPSVPVLSTLSWVPEASYPSSTHVAPPLPLRTAAIAAATAGDTAVPAGCGGAMTAALVLWAPTSLCRPADGSGNFCGRAALACGRARPSVAHGAASEFADERVHGG